MQVHLSPRNVRLTGAIHGYVAEKIPSSRSSSSPRAPSLTRAMTATALLEKPLDIPPLLATMRRLLDEGPAPPRAATRGLRRRF